MIVRTDRFGAIEAGGAGSVGLIPMEARMSPPMVVLILTMAVAAGPARAEVHLLDAAHTPPGDADPTLACEFLRPYRIYQSGELRGGRSWLNAPRLDLCDVPAGRAHPATRR